MKKRLIVCLITTIALILWGGYAFERSSLGKARKFVQYFGTELPKCVDLSSVELHKVKGGEYFYIVADSECIHLLERAVLPANKSVLKIDSSSERMIVPGFVINDERYKKMVGKGDAIYAELATGRSDVELNGIVTDKRSVAWVIVVRM